MTGMKEIKAEYSKLKKKHKDLPELTTFMSVFGFPKEDDVDSVLSLFAFSRKAPIHLANGMIGFISPTDFILSQDNKFVKHMKTELMEVLKTCVVLHKTFSLRAFEATKSEDPEQIMVETINFVTNELERTLPTVKKALELSKAGWQDSGTQTEEVSYNW